MSTGGKVSVWVWWRRIIKAVRSYIERTPMRDVGTAFALLMVGKMLTRDGNIWQGTWCMLLGVIVYIRADRSEERP